jgi:alginate biosynthesis protein AlgK
LKQEQAVRGALSQNTLELHALEEEDGEESL